MPLFQSAVFYTTVADLRDLPADSRCEVAFAGRSNAGKSSAINALANHLGTKGPSLYNHVDSLDDLRRNVRMRVIGDIIQMLNTVAEGRSGDDAVMMMAGAYRSYARQQTIYNGFVASEGVAGADTHSARPGNSEHQTGLAVDLDDGTGCNLNACFANTPGGQWLAANAWKYGFILRYGDGWQPIVGYTFEPWHYRYVGTAVSTDMHDRGIRTLEEYFGLPAAPDYG